MREGPVSGRTDRTLLGAIARDPAGAFGFAAAFASGFFLAGLVSLVVHEVLGHGLAAVAVGGTFDTFVLSPSLSGYMTHSSVPARSAWIVDWAGIAVQIAFGVLVWAIARRLPQFSGAAGALGMVAAFCVAQGLEYLVKGAVFGRGDAARLADDVGEAGRVVGIVLSVAALLWVLFRAVERIRAWVEACFAPRGRAERLGAFLGAAVLPLVLLLLLLPRADLFPGWVRFAVTGGLLALFTGFIALRSGRPPAAALGGERRRIGPWTGLVCLLVAVVAYVFVVTVFETPLHVGWGAVRTLAAGSTSP
jgi:hypothetical protein